jgi:hypothetical protein
MSSLEEYHLLEMDSLAGRIDREVVLFNDWVEAALSYGQVVLRGGRRYLTFRGYIRLSRAKYPVTVRDRFFGYFICLSVISFVFGRCSVISFVF